MENKTIERSAVRMVVGGIIIVVAIGLSVGFLLVRQNRSTSIERDRRVAELKAGPIIKVAHAAQSGSTREIVLIGEVRPFRSVILYSKTSGYLESITVDKGDKVATGQLLATIIAPEIDNDYAAAQADLDNKKKILDRDKTLLDKQYISSQDKEQSETAVTVAEARLKSLGVQQQYKYLKAPFAGTVTARFADPGALMQNATNASTGALPVVTISQLDKVRIYVYVEQKDAGYLKVGFPVEITLTERADVKIKATITRISGELDPKTRMMLTEIDLINSDDQVIPGSYVQVHIFTPQKSRLEIPREALVIRDGKYFVLNVAPDSTIHSQEIKIGENTGNKITVLNGITTEETFALNAGTSVDEGQKVRIQK